MKVSRTLERVAFGLASAASVTQAWSNWLPPLNALVARADGNSQVGQNTAIASTATSASSTGTIEAFTISETGTTSATGSSTKHTASTTSKSAKTTSGSKSGNSTTHTSFTDAQAGSMTMISPSSAAYKPLYKAGDTITWQWNYTNVQATPTAIDILLSCSSITQSWTLTANMSWASPATFTWDSGVQATNAQQPLVPNNYTLVVKDSDDSITAAAEGGYLGVQSSFTFAIYTPQVYTDLANWECTTCIVGIGSRSTDFAIPMIITSLFASAGFMWFLNGLDL